MEFTPPPKCQTCPFVADAVEHIEAHEKDRAEMIENAMSDDLEANIDGVLRMARDEGLVLDDDRMNGENIAAKLRMTQGGAIEMQDAVIEGHTNDLKEHVARCMGAVTLRGSRDGRRIYTVTICGSPAMPDADSEPARVRRTLK